jgi:UPF0755 protein
LDETGVRGYETVKRIFHFLLFAAALVYGLAGIYLEMERELVPALDGRTLEVAIAEGQSALQAAEAFERAGAVTRAEELVKWMKRGGIEKKLLPGTYRVKAGRPVEVAAQLAAAKPVSPSATIIPGAVFDDIAGSVPGGGAETLSAALRLDSNFPGDARALLPDSERDRITLLAPDTYAVPSGDKYADTLVSRASAKWWEQHGDALSGDVTSADIASLGVLASIVQKEALMDSDRQLIAGVMRNRLKLDMPLQIDATVVHAWKLRGVKKNSLTYNDLTVESPFNTYLHKGLPPENIGVPGKESWDAALNPADTDMLFYFARRDGFHIFTRTYQEHLAMQKKEREKTR